MKSVNGFIVRLIKILLYPSPLSKKPLDLKMG